MKINTIINSDCLIGLKELPDECVDCCVTSPPYYGLRDYGVDGQIGLEETPEAYVLKLVELFREVRRVLKKEGTLWLNLGDSYAGSGKGSNPDGTIHPSSLKGIQGTHKGTIEGIKKPQKAKEIGLKPKDLIGIPWMVAFALRADGWYLRQDIIWNKPNPMPESVTDRCTKAHEYIFLLSKSQQYYYDADTVKEKEKSVHKGDSVGGRKYVDVGLQGGSSFFSSGFANKRSVWTVTTKPFSEAHFATFPEDLIAPCIKAGCPEKGIVLDPFMGAGTTAVVCKKLHRNYIGFELNSKYIKIAEKRIRRTRQTLFVL